MDSYLVYRLYGWPVLVQCIAVYKIACASALASMAYFRARLQDTRLASSLVFLDMCFSEAGTKCYHLPTMGGFLYQRLRQIPSNVFHIWNRDHGFIFGC